MPVHVNSQPPIMECVDVVPWSAQCKTEYPCLAWGEALCYNPQGSSITSGNDYLKCNGIYVIQDGKCQTEPATTAAPTPAPTPPGPEPSAQLCQCTTSVAASQSPACLSKCPALNRCSSGDSDFGFQGPLQCHATCNGEQIVENGLCLSGSAGSGSGVMTLIIGALCCGFLCVLASIGGIVYALTKSAPKEVGHQDICHNEVGP